MKYRLDLIKDTTKKFSILLKMMKDANRQSVFVMVDKDICEVHTSDVKFWTKSLTLQSNNDELQHRMYIANQMYKYLKRIEQ